MKPHEIYPPEITYFNDRVTGARVKKLTGWLGHSSHPYFTDDGFFTAADGRERMLFVSDRANARNLHCADIESGEIWRLSDLPAGLVMPSFPMAVNHARNETYYQFSRKVYAISLDTLETRHLFDVPEGYTFGGLRPMAGGTHAVGGLTEDTSKRVKANLSAGYIGMKDVFMAKPHCRIIKVDVDTGKYDEIYSESSWTGHVNPSPTIPNLITYCHEGPWELVDHRIWLLDTDTGKKARLRERRADGEMIGHEYWFLDGEHIGYQVHRQGESGRDTWFGFVRHDGTGEMEAPCVSLPSPDHIHSNGFDLVVSDSGKHIKGYWNEGGAFSSPRIICMHDGSFDWGGHHPHPRLTKDGGSVVFNSTAAGYCNIYIAPIPSDHKDLPVAVAGRSY